MRPTPSPQSSKLHDTSPSPAGRTIDPVLRIRKTFLPRRSRRTYRRGCSVFRTIPLIANDGVFSAIICSSSSSSELPRQRLPAGGLVLEHSLLQRGGVVFDHPEV